MDIKLISEISEIPETAFSENPQGLIILNNTCYAIGYGENEVAALHDLAAANYGVMEGFYKGRKNGD